MDTLRAVPSAAVPAMTSEWLPAVALNGIVTDLEMVPVLEVVTVAKRTGSLWNVIVAVELAAQPLHETATLSPRAGVVSEAVQVVVVEGDALADDVGEAVAEPLGEAVGEVVGHGVGDGEALGVALADAVGEAVGEPVGEPVGEAVGEAVGVGVGEAVGHGVGVGVGDGVCPNGVGDGVCPNGVGDGVCPNGVGVGVGVAVGSAPSSLRIAPRPVSSANVGRSDGSIGSAPVDVGSLHTTS
jgi:hypothetical protein